MLLAIDTSAGTSVAVVDPDLRLVLAERSTADTRRHAEVIGPFLAAALAESGVEPEALTAVVAGMGPGPFTGLRVGIVAARAFAAARGIPVLPLVSHDAAAAAVDARPDLDDSVAAPFVVLTDARRREQYWSVYVRGASGPAERIAGPGLARPADLGAVLDEYADAPRVDVTAISAGRLGLVAADRLALGLPFASDEPLYLRDPDVTMPGAPKRVRA